MILRDEISDDAFAVYVRLRIAVDNCEVLSDVVRNISYVFDYYDELDEELHRPVTLHPSTTVGGGIGRSCNNRLEDSQNTTTNGSCPRPASRSRPRAGGTIPAPRGRPVHTTR